MAEGKRKVLRLPAPKARDYESLLDLLRMMRLDRAGEETGSESEIECILARTLRNLCDLLLELDPKQLNRLLDQINQDIALCEAWSRFAQEQVEAAVNRFEEALIVEEGMCGFQTGFSLEPSHFSIRRLASLYAEMVESFDLSDAASFDLKRHLANRDRILTLNLLRGLLNEAMKVFLETEEK